MSISRSVQIVEVPLSLIPLGSFDREWAEIAGEANDEEKEALEMLDGCKETSRLSCQVQVTDEMDGMVVRLPESQY